MRAHSRVCLCGCLQPARVLWASAACRNRVKRRKARTRFPCVDCGEPSAPDAKRCLACHKLMLNDPSFDYSQLQRQTQLDRQSALRGYRITPAAVAAWREAHNNGETYTSIAKRAGGISRVAVRKWIGTIPKRDNRFPEYIFPCSICLNGIISRVAETGWECNLQRAGKCRPNSAASLFKHNNPRITRME